MEFTRSRPFATWLATLSASFAGSLLANPLLGKPVMLRNPMTANVEYFLKYKLSSASQKSNTQVLAALSSERNLMMATVVWWAVCYSPADIVYSVATNKVTIVISFLGNVMCNLLRAHSNVYIYYAE